MTESYHLESLITFIQEELDRRDWTQAKLAQEMKVRHTTIRNIMKRKLVEYPTTDTFAKLAKATHIDLCSIIALIHPDATNINAEAAIIANRVAQLPPDRLELFDDFILWLSSQKGSDGGNKSWRINKDNLD